MRQSGSTSFARSMPRSGMFRRARAREGARAANAGEVAARRADRKADIPGAVHAARVEAVRQVLHQAN